MNAFKNIYIQRLYTDSDGYYRQAQRQIQYGIQVLSLISVATLCFSIMQILQIFWPSGCLDTRMMCEFCIIPDIVVLPPALGTDNGSLCHTGWSVISSSVTLGCVVEIIREI